MAATQRAGRMRGKRILLTQAIRQQNIHQRALIIRQQDQAMGLVWALLFAVDSRRQVQARNVALVGDNRRLRLALGHERPGLALVLPLDMGA